MKKMVIWNEPQLRALPGEITPAFVREAALPLKIQAMSKAIEACTDLPELLNYKRTADALAAAVRTIKHELPAEAARLNTVAKECLLRLGQLLNQYSSASEKLGRRRPGPSERGRKATELGIHPNLAISATRFADAPESIRKSVLADPKISVDRNAHNFARRLPPRGSNFLRHTDAARRLFGMGGPSGLTYAAIAVRHVKTFNDYDSLTDVEKDKARKLVVEMQEILDETDRRLTAKSKAAA